MMKKKYIMPETEVYLVSSVEAVMLATSDTDANDSTIFSKDTGGSTSNMWEYMDNDD